eukprot:jgi/Chlat1/3792/Chrsp259S03923
MGVCEGSVLGRVHVHTHTHVHMCTLAYTQGGHTCARTHMHTSACASVEFEVTTKDATAREHFILGLKCLHSFWYDLATEQFSKSRALDPSLLMSSWGVAMSVGKLPLWNSEDLEAGADAIAGAATESDRLTSRERRYIRAATRLFEVGKGRMERERSYAEEMRALSRDYPDDADAAAFLALALLSLASNPRLSSQEAESVTKEAYEVIEEAYARWPEHPGVLHYMMHAYDVPERETALLGVRAAEAYPKVAVSSSHALHMPVRYTITLGEPHLPEAWRLGRLASQQRAQRRRQRPILHGCSVPNTLVRLWYNNKNLIIINNNNNDMSTFVNVLSLVVGNVYHSLEYLQHDYHQLGSTTPRDLREYDRYAYRMWARQVIATGDYSPLASSPLPSLLNSPTEPDFYLSEAGLLYASALARLLDKRRPCWPLPTASSSPTTSTLPFSEEEYEGRFEGGRGGGPGSVLVREVGEIEGRMRVIGGVLREAGLSYQAGAVEVMQLGIEAVAAHLLGRDTQSLRRRLSSTQAGMKVVPDSPTLLFADGHALAGDIALAEGLAEEARGSYLKASELLTNDAASMLGIARASAMLKDKTVAREWYERVANQWARGDTDFTIYQEVQAAVEGQTQGNGCFNFA